MVRNCSPDTVIAPGNQRDSPVKSRIDHFLPSLVRLIAFPCGTSPYVF